MSITQTSLKRFCVLILTLILISFDRGFSESGKDVDYSNEAIPLRLKTGMVTEAEFPENIATVAKSISSDLLQIETLNNRMFLLPRDNFDTRLHIVTQDNASYILHLIMDDAAAPTCIRIGKRPKGQNDPQNKEIADTIALMKVLLRNEVPQGSSQLSLDGREVFNNGTLRMSIDKAYELGGGAKALVLVFENLMDKPIVLPIENIELPGLLAISVDNQLLEARPRGPDKHTFGSTTKAYMLIEGKDK